MRWMCAARPYYPFSYYPCHCHCTYPKSVCAARAKPSNAPDVSCAPSSYRCPYPCQYPCPYPLPVPMPVTQREPASPRPRPRPPLSAPAPCPTRALPCPSLPRHRRHGHTPSTTRVFVCAAPTASPPDIQPPACCVCRPSPRQARLRGGRHGHARRDQPSAPTPSGIHSPPYSPLSPITLPHTLCVRTLATVLDATNVVRPTPSSGITHSTPSHMHLVRATPLPLCITLPPCAYCPLPLYLPPPLSNPRGTPFPSAGAGRDRRLETKSSARVAPSPPVCTSTLPHCIYPPPGCARRPRPWPEARLERRCGRRQARRRRYGR